MNKEVQISQLIARKIAGVSSESELYEWKKITENDPEMEQALDVIINLWNAQGIRNKKEVEAAFRKVSLQLNKKRATVININLQQRRSGLLRWWGRTCCE